MSCLEKEESNKRLQRVRQIMAAKDLDVVMVY